MSLLTRLHSWVSDKNASISITASRVDADTDAIVTALNGKLDSDGTKTAAANQPMGGFKHTGVGTASARTEYGVVSQIQDQSYIWCGTGGGTADVITLNPSPVITAYAAGQRFVFIASGANTTNVTVNVSSLGAKALTKSGSTALVANDIPSGAILEITYDGTQFQLEGLLTPANTVTTDTAQTITGAKTFSANVTLEKANPLIHVNDTSGVGQAKIRISDNGVPVWDILHEGNVANALDITDVANTARKIQISVGGGVQIGVPTGGDKGANTLNVASTIFQNNVPVVTETGTQTLTNKTLTSPTVNTPTITGGTVNPTTLQEGGNNAVVAGDAAGGALAGTYPNPSLNMFESSEQALPAASTTLTVAHGLGSRPRFVRAVLRCVTGELSYVAGDEVDIGSTMDFTDGSCSLWATSTDVGFRKDDIYDFTVARRDAVGDSGITAGNWRMVFYAIP